MEKWRDIPGFEGFYQASDEGRVKSLERVTLRKNGVPLSVSEKILSPSIGSHGYPVVNLRRDNKTTQRTVHSLIAEAFLGSAPHGEEVRHRDGDRTNPRLDNLIYGTRLQNVADAIAHGTHVHGETVGNSKLKEVEVLAIRGRLVAGEAVMELAREFGVTHTSIISIRERRNWSWLT